MHCFNTLIKAEKHNASRFDCLTSSVYLENIDSLSKQVNIADSTKSPEQKQTHNLYNTATVIEVSGNKAQLHKSSCTKINSNLSTQADQSLLQVNAVTIWVKDDAIKCWNYSEQRRSRGRSFQFTDSAIITALTIKKILGLTLRELEGFLNTVFKLMDIPLISPSYSCISKRTRTAEVPYNVINQGLVDHVVIDSAGLRVFSKDEWSRYQNGKQSRCVWKKIHLTSIAGSHEIIADINS
ncbi:hypothetical protein MACH09_16120 [Vibrio sp. MACH09]|nr:transposase [Vibrio sp. MACH09]GLO61104.1 hypothetical protein MACH09_16120 [Vibrio sp. MACH09]